MPDNTIIDFHNLAYRTGMPPEDLRAAGGKLFEQLSGIDPDLTKALVAAATESGLDPRQVLSIMATFAEDFRRPIPESAPHSLSEKATEVRAIAKEKLNQTADYVRSNLAEIDIGSIKDSGTDKLREVRDRIAEVDVAEIANRAKEAAQSVLGNARDLAKSVGDSSSSPKNGKPYSDAPKP